MRRPTSVADRGFLARALLTRAYTLTECCLQFSHVCGLSLSPLEAHCHEGPLAGSGHNPELVSCIPSTTAIAYTHNHLGDPGEDIYPSSRYNAQPEQSVNMLQTDLTKLLGIRV